MSESEIKETIWRGRLFRYAPLLLWISVIFYLSSSNGAMSNTSRFIRPLLEWLFPLMPEETLQIYHGYIRKFAHFAEYSALAFFASRAFWSSSIEIFRKYWFIFAFGLVVCIASIDEYNQSFNVLRTSSIYDVLLDASGGLTIVILIWFFRTRTA